MSPSPLAAHQRVLLNLARLIGNFLESNSLGESFSAPLDTILAQDQVLQPDLLYVSNERASIVDRWVFGAPDLAVEIMSDTSRRRDEVRQARALRAVRRCGDWIVDPEADHVTVYRLSNGRYSDGIVVRETLTTPLLPGLEIDLARVFAPR